MGYGAGHRVLVTGGGGFVGSHLVDGFLARGCEVVAVDNNVTGTADNIAHLADEPRFSFVSADVSVGDLAEALPVDGKFDVVAHFASPASPADFGRIPVEILRVNSQGTQNCLDLAREHGARFLLASTSEVYGDPQVHPQPESYYGNVSSTGPRAVYDEAKRYAEAITMAYHRNFGVDVRIVRIFNTYGPRMRIDDGRAIPNFIAQALADEPITLYGEGRTTRSICYVSDLVNGILLLLDSDQTGPMNCGTEHEMTMHELAELIRDIIGSKSEFSYLPLPENDPLVRRPDLTRISTELGYQPQVAPKEGLRRTIEDLAAKIGIPLKA
ncbi:NAD-dependent epimerase/dehydratase family protein [Fodinicola acaciae]|uniref:NAD-dependent epimerase/dehydratase family protein n=1 Tax=Fodinicola acaciae TaxID=2681555 RepID=UPI001C9E4C8D|nr:NAD-dependent epimerase/dehydratase family protein [Fodinicola acaciae]